MEALAFERNEIAYDAGLEEHLDAIEGQAREQRDTFGAEPFRPALRQRRQNTEISQCERGMKGKRRECELLGINDGFVEPFLLATRSSRQF